jgi:GNAT superfamily N-acetyltransferase
MPKTEILKDGAEIVIRDMDPRQDFEALMTFYTNLPEEDRRYLRIDVTNRKTMEQRIKLMEFGYHFRILALHGEEVVGVGVLELPFEEWRRHQGEMRVIIARPFQRRGVGMLLMRELYGLALRKNMETVAVWLMRPQTAALNLARKMGFHDQSILPDYVKDQTGSMQDLYILKGKIADLTSDFEKVFGPVDWSASL